MSGILVATIRQAALVADPGTYSASDDRPRFFYGWVIVAFTFVVQFVAMGTLFYAFGVLLKPLTEALDADRFSVSLALSIQIAIAALLNPWVGRLIAERSIRALMLGGAAAMSLGFFMLAQAQTLWHLYVSFGVILSVGMALVGPLPNNTMLANWFVRRRGTAMGLSQLGVSLSGAVLVPLTTWIVLGYGWRTAVGVFAALPLIVLVPLIWKFAIRRPEDVGRHPDGDPQADILPEPVADDWSMARAVRDRRIWLLTLILGPSFMGVGAVVLALYAHATDVGLSGAQASIIVSLAAFMAALAKPLFGTLADYVNKRLVMVLSLVLQIVGLALLVVFQSYTGLLVAAVIFGLGYGGVMPMWSVLLGTLFGRDAFSRVMGLMGPMTMPFMLAGLPFANLIYETTGSYVDAFAMLIGALLISIVALAFLRLPVVGDAITAD